MIFLCCLLMKRHLQPGFLLHLLFLCWDRNETGIHSWSYFLMNYLLSNHTKSTSEHSHLCGIETRAFWFPTSKQWAPQRDWKIHSGICVLNSFSSWIKDWSKKRRYFNFYWVFKQKLKFAFPFPKLSCFCPHCQNWRWTWVGFRVGLCDPKGLFQPKRFHNSDMKPQRNVMNPLKWSQLSLGGWAKASCGNYWPTLVRICGKKQK